MSGTRTGIVPQQGRTLLPEQIARNGRLYQKPGWQSKKVQQGKATAVSRRGSLPVF